MKHCLFGRASALAACCMTLGGAAGAATIEPMPDHPEWGYVSDYMTGGVSYKAYVYTNVTEQMSFAVPADVTSLDYLVVAGGGSGGARSSTEMGGAGGGGGGVLAASATVAAGQTFAVTVGAGGAAVNTSRAGNQGGNSTLVCAEASVNAVAIGGGAGGQYQVVGGDGGCGGGGGGKNGGNSVAYAGGKGTDGQGYAGGYGFDFANGGGGGAGGPGGNGATLHDGGTGGVGIESAITGETHFYGAGGAGSGSLKNKVTGADGAAAEDGAAVGQNGTDGLGAGGGGQVANVSNAFSGAGGSGTVIIRYADGGSGPSEKTIYTRPEIVETLSYTGAEQKPEIAESEGYTIEWTGDWTHVGEHAVTLTLVDLENSIWDDGSTEPKTYTCTITQATNAWTVEPTIALQWETGTTPDLSLGTPAFGEVVMTPADLAALPTGAATVTFTVAATDDYTALEKAVAVFVVPQGLKPTGDPDTVATTYTWAGEESGYWYNPGAWTSNAEPCFGFPANGVATALFNDATATVEGNTLAYDLAKLQITSSAVTLKGGSYAPTSVVLDGTAPTLVLTDGSELAPATRQALQLTAQQNVTLAVTNATLKTGFSIRNGATGFTATLHNATFDGAFELANSGATTADSDQSVIFSGADSKLAFGDGTSFNNQGLAVCFETGVNAAFSAREVKVGKNSSLTFAGENEISATGYIYANGDNATITFGSGAQMTSGNGLNDFGLYRNASGLTNARTVIDNATITAGNQVYMPHPNRANLAGCGVTFKGDHPRVTVGNTDVYIGKATPAEGEVLPSWRYELPATPYEVAPLVITAAAAKVRFVSNTPIELDLTAVTKKGRYPLMTFAADTTVDVEQLTAAMSAFTVRASGAHHDVKEDRVTLGYDDETKTIYADVAQTPGMTLLVR